MTATTPAMPPATPLAAPPPAQVRDARPEDMATVAEIYGHYVTQSLATFEETAPSPDEMTRRHRDVLAHGLPYLIAEDPSGIVGFVYASPYRMRSAYRYTIEDSIYVPPRAIGRGLGRLLLGSLVERCAALGFRQMVAVIGDSGNAASIGLHGHLGFRPAGTLRNAGFKHGRWVDAVIMQRSLGEAGTTPPPPREPFRVLG